MPKIGYIPVGDCLLPAITMLDPSGAEPLTKYGLMRRSYLKNHRPILYSRLLIQERLYPRLRATQRAAEERLEINGTTRQTRPAAGQSLLWDCMGATHSGIVPHGRGNNTRRTDLRIIAERGVH